MRLKSPSFMAFRAWVLTTMARWPESVAAARAARCLPECCSGLQPAGMVQQDTEPLLSLAQASKLRWLPCRRHGKRPAVATLWRWATHGCFGIRLRTLSVGGTLCVRESDLLAFFHELGELRGRGTGT